MASVNTMLAQVAGLIDTKDLTDVENSFMKNCWRRSEEGKRPDKLTGPQVEWLEDLHAKHFGN